MILGLIAHGFAFANKLPGYDDIFSTFGKGATLMSGRWGLLLMEKVYPNQSMPWIYGLISIFLISVSICIMLEMFHVRSKVLQCLFAGCVIAFPSLTCTIIYMFTLSSYATAFLLAVLGAWLMQKCTLKHGFLAVICLILSLGIYQSYVSITASLLVLLLIQELLLNTASPIRCIKKGVVYLGYLVISLGSYYVLTLIVNRLLGDELSTYANEKIFFSLSYLPTGIYHAYRSFILFFRDGLWGLFPTKASRILHIVCLLSCLTLFFTWLFSQKKPSYMRFLLLFVLIALFPLAVNCMYLFIDSDPAAMAIHTLVLFGFVTTYLFAAVLIEACNLPSIFNGRLKPTISRISTNLVALCLSIIICINLYVANGIYLELFFRYENMYSFFSSVITEAKMMEGFDEDTEIAICGLYEEPDFYYNNFTYAYAMTGTDGFQPTRSARTYFMEYYLGVDIPIVSKSEAQAFTETEEYAAMPVYPYYGSMKFFGDTLVIKLS